MNNSELQAQLAEAVGLLRDYGHSTPGVHIIQAFIDRIAQAEQQEECVHEFVPFQPACLKCGELYQAEQQEAQGAQAGEFEREDRYIVIKRKDLEKTPTLMTHAFIFALDGLLNHLPKRECLVIESDWPEYEPTWAAIQARVTGQGAQAGDELDVVAEAIFNADKDNWYSVGPYSQLHANDKARLRVMALATQPAVCGPVEIEVPTFSPEGMGCGLEDRGITDRYEAMEYGYNEALDQQWAIINSHGPLFAAPPAAAPVAVGEPVACRHRLADARNKHISSGYFCLDCGAAFAAADHAAPPAAAHGDEAARRDAVAAYVDMSCNSMVIDGAHCYYLPSERMEAFDRMFSLGDAMRAQGDGE